MTKKSPVWTAALCACFLLGGSMAQADDVSDVETAAERLRVVMVDPDKAQLEALTASELSYGHSSGKVDTQESLIGNLMSGSSDFLSLNVAEQSVKVLGDVAVLRHTLTGDTHGKGKPPASINLKVLQVWRKQGSDWKLLARQAVTNNAP